MTRLFVLHDDSDSFPASKSKLDVSYFIQQSRVSDTRTNIAKNLE